MLNAIVFLTNSFFFPELNFQLMLTIYCSHNFKWRHENTLLWIKFSRVKKQHQCNKDLSFKTYHFNTHLLCQQEFCKIKKTKKHTTYLNFLTFCKSLIFFLFYKTKCNPLFIKTVSYISPPHTLLFFEILNLILTILNKLLTSSQSHFSPSFWGAVSFPFFLLANQFYFLTTI